MNDLMLRPGERVILEAGDVVWLRGWFRSRVGRLVFTSERLLFEVRVDAALSPYIVRELKRRVPVDLPRDSIITARHEVYRGRDVLTVATEYEPLRFAIGTVAHAWEKTLRQAIRDDQAALQAVVDALRPRTPPPPYR